MTTNTPAGAERLAAAIAEIAPRFTSGNRIPVEKATVPAAEWHELVAAIAASLSPASVGAEGWKSIDSAPKDGTAILLGRTDDGENGAFVGQGRWVEEDEDGPDNMGHDAGYVDDQYHYFRCGRSFGNPEYQDEGLQPTHWMPLPPAPGTAAAVKQSLTTAPAPDGTAASTPSPAAADHFVDATKLVAPAAYEAINHLLAHIGAEGSIDARHPLVGGCMKALRAIDGGVYLAKLGAVAAVGAGGETLTRLDRDYWLSNRAPILQAITNAGFKLMSNRDGFWLQPSTPAGGEASKDAPHTNNTRGGA